MKSYRKNKKVEIKAFEGFAGVGITRLALNDVEKELEVEFDHVGYSEIEPCAIKGYKALHGDTLHNYGDITKVEWENVDADFITLTFPCQSISSAGVNDGFEEGSNTKSSLGWEIKEILT